MSIRHDSVCVRVPSYVSLLAITICVLVPSTFANTLPTLGTADNYAVLGINGTTINQPVDDGPVVVNGNEGVVYNGTINLKEPSTINGNVYVFESSQYQSGGTLNGTLFANNLADADALTADLSLGGTTQTDVNNLLSAIMTEPKTDVTFNSSVTTATQINGIGESGNSCGTDNVCVVKINGNINLSNANLILNGTSSDSFIIEVTGDLSLTGTASLDLTGGVTSNNVIYDFTGSSGSISIHQNDTVNGILIAANESMMLNGGTVNGELIGGDGITLLANSVVNDPPSATPEPKLTMLLGAMLAALAFLRSRRNRPRRS